MRDLLINAARASLQHAGGVAAIHTATDSGTITNVGVDGLPLIVRLDGGKEENSFGNSLAVSEFWDLYCLKVDVPNIQIGDVFTLTDTGDAYSVKSDPVTGPQSVYWRVQLLP